MSRWVQRAGDCTWTPAKHLHYVRSWGRNLASMWMFQDVEVCVEKPPAMSHGPCVTYIVKARTAIKYRLLYTVPP